MQGVTLNGVVIHYADEGPHDGFPVVFGNSLGTDFRVWDRLVPLLPGSLRVIRYDKRGHGLSDCPEGGWSIETLADDLAALLETLGVRRAVVCGLSVGGMIAQALAGARPELVRGLILADTAAWIGPPEMWVRRIATVEADGMAAIADAVLGRWFTAHFRDTDPALALWRNLLLRTPAAGYVATCAAIRDADLTGTARGLRLPALVVVGGEDGATPPELVRGTADLIPGSRFAQIAGAGHLPPVEQPAALGRLIGDFLRETGHV